MTSLLQDLRQALRKLARSPGFSVAVVLTLALGIGANGAVFSVVRGVLLTALPFEDPDRLVRVFHGHEERGLEPGSFSPQDFDDLRRGAEVYESLAAYWFVPGLSGMNLTGGGDPMRVSASFVSEGFFPILGVPAARGRALAPEENVPGRDRVAVLSDGFWNRRFGGDPEVLGSPLLLDGEPYTVIGVMPPGFSYPSGESDLWVPISLIGDDSIPHQRWLRWLEVLGRLAPGVSPEQAEARTEALAATLADEYPESNEGWTEAAVVPLRETLVGDVRPALLVLFAAVGIVLLIACANLANLFLVRAFGREREMAVRTALGAERGRLVRQLLSESVLVSLAGGVVGLFVTVWGIEALRAAEPAWAGSSLQRPEAVQMDGTVVAFCLVLSVVTGLAFGLLPALRASDLRLSPALSEGGTGAGGRRRNRAGGLLVVAETALAVVLLVGALLLVRSFWRLVEEDPGFRSEGVLALSITTDSELFKTPAERDLYRRQVIDRIAALPGVTAVGGSKTMPLRGGGEPFSFDLPGRPEEAGVVRPESGGFIVTPGYFDALGIEVLQGRDFTWEDGLERPVVVINRRFARQVWGREEVVGESLAAGEERIEVVGVVEDVRQEGLATPPGSAAYVPPSMAPRSTMKLFVRTAGEPLAFAAAVRSAIWEIRPDQPISELQALRDMLRQDTARARLLVSLVGTFAALAAALAAVGLYGVVAYTVGRRTREIGIRMALGAGRGSVLAAVVGRSLALTGAGLALGLAGAWSAAGLLASQLYEVRPDDPATFLAVAALAVLTGLAAAYVPARRAAGVDPMIALRKE